MEEGRGVRYGKDYLDKWGVGVGDDCLYIGKMLRWQWEENKGNATRDGSRRDIRGSGMFVSPSPQ